MDKMATSSISMLGLTRPSLARATPAPLTETHMVKGISSEILCN